MKKKIYILERTNEIRYDENVGMVIVANSKAEARKIANEQADEFGEGKIWEDEDIVSVKIISPYGKSRIELLSYNAG